MKYRKGMGGFNELFYKGKPVIKGDEIPTGEIWFVDKNYFIIKKVPEGKKLNILERWYIYFATVFSELFRKRKNLKRSDYPEFIFGKYAKRVKLKERK